MRWAAASSITTCRRFATIVRDAAKNGHRMSAFILGVINSPAFQMSRAEAVETTAGSSDPQASLVRRHPGSAVPSCLGDAMIITKKHISRRTVLRGMGVTMALPFLDAMVPGPDAAGEDGRGWEDPPLLHRTGARRGRQHQDRPRKEHVVAGRGWAHVRSVADQPQPARAVPRLPHHRLQHRRAQRRSVPAERNRRRPLPLERGVPDPGASEADRRARTSTSGRRSTSSTRRSSGRTRRFRRCSWRSRTSIRPAAAPTATPASTPTPSAGPTPRRRCR